MMVNSKQSKRAVIFKGNINRDFDNINYDDQKTEEYDEDNDERRPVIPVSDGDMTARSLKIVVFSTRSTWVKEISFMVKDFSCLDHGRLKWPPPVPTPTPFFSGGAARDNSKRVGDIRLSFQSQEILSVKKS